MTAASLIPSALNRLGRETDMLLATVDSLSSEEMAGPSRHPGWTLGHVVTHLARNADALSNLVDWAVTGQERAGYESVEARDAAIEQGAQRNYKEIKKDLAQASRTFAEKVQRLRGELAAEEVTLLDHTIAARDLVALREYEVIIHHYDLGTVWTIEESDPEAQLDALEMAVSLFSDRDDAPDVRIVTVEGEEFTLGNGTTTVTGERGGVVEWLVRGVTDSVRCEGELPALLEFDVHP